MEFKRGDKVVWSNILATILGPEDFERYDYNKPDHQWELIEHDNDGHRGWVHRRHLKLRDQIKENQINGTI